MVDGLVDIIIVNWNSGTLLRECISSVLSSNYSNYRIHIIDNASVDGSSDHLPKDSRITVHPMSENVGFGKACNTALKFCNGQYILLLNPDTLIKNQTIQKAVQFIGNHKECIVYGCAQEDEFGKLQTFTVGRFPNFVTFCNDILGLSFLNPRLFKNGFLCTDWEYNKSDYVKHVMGSFYLIKTSWTNEYGFFDDRYFVYLEDIDLSLRIIQSGGKIFYDRDNLICHKQGGISKNVKAKRLFYSLHAKHEFIKKHFSWTAFVLADLIMLVPGFFARIIHAIFIERSFRILMESIKGYGLFYKHLFIKKLL